MTHPPRRPRRPEPSPPMWPTVLVLVGALLLVGAFWYYVWFGQG